MATVYAHTNDGYVSKDDSDWATARDATSGDGSSSTSTRDAFAIRAERTSARGGGYTYTVKRVFMFFDVTSISDDVASATLKVYGYSQTGGDIIALKSDADILSLQNADFNDIEGWSTGSADGSGGGDNEGNVTKYSAEISTWSSSGYNDITLNAQALEDIRDDGVVYICLMNYDYDLKDIAPTGYSTHRNGLYFTDYTGTSYAPYIDYALVGVDTGNSVFFGHNF